MSTIRFDKVSIRGVRHWIENGKRRQETKEFFQTINPFNKAADGLPKSRDQIMAELVEERRKWGATQGVSR